MKDLIKAQLFQIKHTRVYYIVFIFVMCMAAFFGAAEWLNGTDALDEGQLLTASDFATRMSMLSTMGIMAISFFANFLCAEDFADKTINYEYSSGRIRKQSFLARIIVSVSASVILAELMMFASLVVYTALCGWGDSVPAGAVAIRLLLCIFPYFRFACFVVMTAYMIKRPALTFGCLYLGLQILTIAAQNIPIKGNVTSINTLMSFMHYDYRCTFGLARDACIIYTPSPEVSTIAGGIIWSLLFGLFYLFIAYSYNHKDDID